MLQKGLNDILISTSKELDIPDYVYEDATIKYEDVGDWLAADTSQLKKYLPEIYPQGSFRLGTVVRPISGSDEYDIDLVCTLDLVKEQTSQANLKEMVGDRLKLRADLNNILKPSRRCWTLDYPAQDTMPNFHMDILPSINNLDNPPTGILLTDTELKLWQKSNPKAYAEWFYQRMEAIFLEQRTVLAKSFNAKVEDIPEWQVKTPLQRAIQILKRHRDIYFQKQSENKPISIIITTLAAHAYRGDADIYSALQTIVRDMPKFIEHRNGKWWISNPVADENFADKWNEYPERRKAFLEWLTVVQKDFATANEYQNLNEMVKSLTPALGQKTMEKVAFDMGLSSASLPVVLTKPQVPALGSTIHCRLPLWNQNLQFKAQIRGSLHLKEGGRKLWLLTDSPVPRNLHLRFTVNTNVPSPYQIQWQVVNTGDDALRAGDLRGGFLAGGSHFSPVHWERTEYKGTHWIEAFVIKDGVCLARSGKKFVRIR